MCNVFKTILSLGFIAAPVINAGENPYKQFRDEDEAAYKQLDQSLAMQFLTRPANEVTPEMYEAYEQWKPSSMAYEWTPGVKTEGAFAGSEYAQLKRSWISQFFRRHNAKRADCYEQAYRKQDPSLFKPSWLERLEHKVAGFLYPPRPRAENKYSTNMDMLKRLWRKYKYHDALEHEHEKYMFFDLDAPIKLNTEYMSPERYIDLLVTMSDRQLQNHLKHEKPETFDTKLHEFVVNLKRADREDPIMAREKIEEADRKVKAIENKLGRLIGSAQ